MATTTATVTAVPCAPVPDDIARELRAIARRRERDEAKVKALVVRARDLGCSQRALGDLLGMTHVGIAKLEQRAREEGVE